MIQAGEKLWNGATVTPELAAAYNWISERIAAFEREGRPAPEQLLNGRHNLIASAVSDSGYAVQMAYMRANLPLLQDIRFQAKRERRHIVERVLMADDTIATVSAGPRGGLRILARM